MVASVVLGILVVTTVVNDNNISTIKEKSTAIRGDFAKSFDFGAATVFRFNSGLNVSATGEAGFDSY
jgi:hypothetical protein